MSIPGDPHPHHPYAQPQPNPYGQVPAQQNPYAQPAPPQGPGGGYGYPAPGAPAGAGSAPGAPGGPDSPGRGAFGWLWAIGGAIAASAIWGSLLFATGGFSSEPSPDLAGYSYTSDLCADTSMTPFENAHFKAKESSGTSAKDANPQHSASRQPSLDTMWCNISLQQENAGSPDYSSTWLYSTVSLHKKADPTPEFADSYRSYEKQDTSIGYKVESVPGLGDEAYLVTRNDQGGSSNGAYVILGVRDGWMTYQSTWAGYASSSSSGKQPTATEVATMLKTSATQTLKQLQRFR
ncbi:hypothetical protein AB0C96_06670 [Streptomyces sp. NPDC048506]|uniref:hypothetical protein n=1 Tax=Streptomyces sp. NPDC048506 TaxID=3155028 RepID=UPI0034338069